MKKWFIKEAAKIEEITKLKEESLLDSISCSLLLQRGISDFTAVKDFFYPNIELLHSSFEMLNMDEAIKLLNKTINNNEKILIYGDYDVDGTTAVSVVYLSLKKYYSNIDFYIPDRYSEGYGISEKGIEFAKENSFSLIITLDCGIKAVDKISLAKNYGINVIVCDHHEPGNELPDAIILNPKQKKCNYPYKELTGCGVGFKLMTALYTNNKWDMEFLYSHIDLVAISIAADIVPVTGENRILAFYGLKILNKNTRKSISLLLSKSGHKDEITFSNIVFIIAPRINAAGRIHHGKKAVQLIISEDIDEIKKIAIDIEANNIERKKLDSNITEEAILMLKSDENYNEKLSTVVFNETWSKGVIGIVASRLIETFYKPTIVFTETDGKLTGSARSVIGLNIHDCIDECSVIVEQFGGHAFAAGLTIKKENFDIFKEKFEESVSNKLNINELVPQEIIDLKISFSDLFEKKENYWEIPKSFKVMEKMEPFGPGNDRPIFLTENVYVDDIKVLKEEHLKLQLRDPKTGIVFSGIAFKSIDKLEICINKNPIDIIYSLNKNIWNSKVNLQLVVKDIRQSII